LPVSGAEQLSDSDASGVGQEEIPQPCRLRLGLRAFKQLKLPRRPAPTVGAPFAEAEKLLGDRIDIFGDVALHRIEQRLRLL
jgi:hypothetical protein